MSKYTTEVRFICESMSGLSESADGAMVDDIIASARPKIFNFDYPIFDEAYRQVIESKILRHYYTREIGQETVGLWMLKLETKLTEIMPYYNKLYKSELLEYNPLYDTNYTRSGSGKSNQSETTSNNLSTSGNGSSTSSENDNNWNLYQETPQNGLNGVDTYEYLTTATNNKGNRTGSASEQSSSTSNGSGNRNANDTKEYLENIVGYRSNNPSKLLKDYRATFLNIDLMVINELENLFIQLW